MRRCAALALLALAGPAAAAPAADLGRLFFRPEERAALDAARAAAVMPPEGAAREARPAAEIDEAAAPVPLSVEGYVLRRQGDGTAWINGRSTPQEDLPLRADEGPALRLSREGVVVETGEGGRRRLVKPGQSYDPGQDRLRDAYQGAGAGRAPPP